jgi:prephenate dehydratase
MNPNKLITLGPKGSFHEIAARVFYPEAELVLVSTPQQIFEKVNKGVAPGLIAELDTYAPAVNDQVAGIHKDYAVLEERDMPISLCLASPSRSSGSSLETVMSHPQAFALCAGLLQRAYPKVSLQACESTSAAASEITKSMKPHSAVLCHPETASAYGLQVLMSPENLGVDHQSRFCLFSLKPAN